MVKKTKGSGRFGARYGAPLKQKRLRIEEKQKKSYTCPRCLKDKVKRVSSGIWYCNKCDTKFAGRAYSLEE
jgi:large subunit ribosomal protein L37Ae